MARTRINPLLVKLHRSYTVEETSRLLNVHRNTVRAWLKSGLPVIDTSRPALIQGKVLRAFLEARRVGAKRPSPPGTMYCLKCRGPRSPALGMVDFIPREARAGNLQALCETCGTTMHRRARQSLLSTILPGLEVLIAEAPLRIAECPRPSLKCA
jgi:hypothetical protein